MPLFESVALTPFFLEDHELASAQMAQHSGCDFSAGHMRGAQCELLCMVQGQYRLQSYLGTGFSGEPFHFQLVARRHPILFAARLYYGI